MLFQIQKVIIIFALFKQLNILVHQKIISIDTFVCIEIIDDIIAKAHRNRFALLRGAIVETTFTKVQFLAVEGRAVLEVVVIPVSTVDEIFALGQRMIVGIQGLEAGIKVQCLLAFVGHVLVVNGAHGNGTATNAIIKGLYV